MEDQNINLLDILLDEDNQEPITLYGENDKEVKFDQVAIIPMDDKLYAILKPVDKLEEVGEDEAIVFLVREDVEEPVLEVVLEEEVAIKVFDEYNKLVDEQK